MRLRENPEDCAIRETLEETGLTVKKLERVGVLNFYKNGQREVPDWTVYVFLTQDFEGKPKDGREGVLKWFDVDSLPYEEMWEDDRFWCRRALDRGEFEGWFYFSGDFEKLIDHKVEAKQTLAHYDRSGHF